MIAETALLPGQVDAVIKAYLASRYGPPDPGALRRLEASVAAISR